MAGGCVGQSGVAGICVRLLFVWCLGALVPCVVCSLYYTIKRTSDDHRVAISPSKSRFHSTGFQAVNSVPLDALIQKNARKSLGACGMSVPTGPGTRNTEL